MLDDRQLEHLARERFGLRPIADLERLSAGNINRSAVVPTDDGRFILQELNPAVFGEPEKLMANAIAIIDRMEAANLPVLRYVPTTDGAWLAALDDVPWRCYRFVEGDAQTALNTTEDAQATARAFGRYAEAIDGLELHEHLPGYHDFDHRVADLQQAVDGDPHGRARPAAETIEHCLRAIDRLRLSSSYDAWREVPVRNAHNDAKAPNCVIAEGGSRTIIDLDTTMPGTILADVGELVRSATRGLDEPTPSELMGQIEAVNRGFLAGYRRELSDAEHASMLLAGPLLTVENAVRFLSDHLTGDRYYGADDPGDNLRRADAQVELAQAQMDAIEYATAG